MSEVEFSALHHVFPAELLKYFSIVFSGVRTDEPTGEEYLEVVFEEKNELPEVFHEITKRVRAF
jgi:hypothetical protein